MRVLILLCRATRFKGFRQQDSQELLRYLLDSIRNEEIKVLDWLFMFFFNAWFVFLQPNKCFMKGCRPGKRRLAKVSKRRINCQSLWMRGAGGWGSRTICEPTIHAIRTSHGTEIKLYEVSNTWKMFLLGASGMWGLASGMFAESLGLGQLSLISVKRSFYWLGLWTHFTDWG